MGRCGTQCGEWCPDEDESPAGPAALVLDPVFLPVNGGLPKLVNVTEDGVEMLLSLTQTKETNALEGRPELLSSN